MLDRLLDAHVHVWTDDVAAYPFAPHDGLPTPSRPFTIGQLTSAMDAAGVAQALAIQPRIYGYDHGYLFAAAAGLAGRLRVMPLINTVRPSGVVEMETLAVHDAVAGFRVITQNCDPVRSLLDPSAQRLWTRLVELALPVGLLIEPEQLPVVATLAAREPDLRVVVDHCASVRTGSWPQWGRVLLGLSRLPNVYVKVSALGHLSNRPFPYVDLHGHLRDMLESYGPGHLLWGSDWPHVYGHGSYEDSSRPVAALLKDASHSERNRVLSETARSLFAFPAP